MKVIKILFICLNVILLMVVLNIVEACSLAVLDGNGKSLVCRTMDWLTPDGYVVKNYPGTKRSPKFIFFNPYKWTAKWGSISFNLAQKVIVGKVDVPGCGLNEKGFYAAELWVVGPPNVKYPRDNSKQWITTAEVVQMLIDNCATVDEAVTLFKKVSLEQFRILSIIGDSLDLHYFVADASGKMAILEYPKAEITIYDTPKSYVMTNNFIATSIQELSKYVGFGGNIPIPETVPFDQRTSFMRFIQNSDSITKLKKAGQVSVDAGFSLIDRIKANDSPVTAGDDVGITTQWSIVYDMKNRVITYTSASNSNRRFIDMKRLTFREWNNSTGKRISVQAYGQGDITNIFLN